MSIYKAQFGSLKFEQLEGYRISAAFTPNDGFRGNFYVYLWDVIDANEAYEKPVKVSESDKRIQDELTITDGNEVTYKFPKIDLQYAEVGATRSQRYRLVEFRYHPNITDRADPGISLENSSKKELQETLLEKDYDYKLDDFSERLYGFRGRLAHGEAGIYRFWALRNKNNSFMKRMVDVNSKQAQGQLMPSFEVGFTQGALKVEITNLVRFFVDESWGHFVNAKVPSMSELLGSNADPELARLNAEEFLPRFLIEQDIQQYRQKETTSDAIETATLVLQAGQFRNLEVT